MVCSAPQADEIPGGRPGRLERWLLFDDAVLSLSFGLAGSCRCDFARLHELADISDKVRRAWRWKRQRHSRLEELVATLELFVFRLDDLDAVHDFHQAGLQSFCLPYEGQRRGPCVRA